MVWRTVRIIVAETLVVRRGRCRIAYGRVDAPCEEARKLTTSGAPLYTLEMTGNEPVRLISTRYGQMATIFIVLTLLIGFVGFGLEWRTAPDPVAPVEARAVDTSGQSLLVDAPWLAQQIERDPSLVIVDLAAKDAYEREHIPGAIHAWWQDMINPHGQSYGMALRLADNPAELQQYAPTLGATHDDTIVVYDNESSVRASWFVWQLRSSGYSRAVVLDGGLAAWKGASLPTTSEPSSPRSVAAPEPTWNSHADIGYEDVLAGLEDPNVIIIDVRSAEQAQDTINDTVPLGRIPGSLTLPEGSAMHPDGTFLTPDEAWAWLRPLQLEPYNEIVIYGRFGADTGQAWLALNLAGYVNVRVYDAGWQGWGSNLQLPVEPLP
jgi:thiosulfate/3-mercaptopyruvate sulfurtransferase